MPNRILRDYTDSQRFDGITADAERLFIRLLTKADDYGRFHAEPRLLRAGCFPLSDNLRTNDLTRWLDELSTRQLILRYETQGRPLLAILNFRQRLKQSRAKFPPPDGKPGDFLPDDAEFREVPGSSGNSPPEGNPKRSRNESDSEPEGEKKEPPASGARWFPESLRDVAFVARWEEWEGHCQELSKPLGSSARRGQLVECERNGRDTAMKALQFSIANNRSYIAWDWQSDTEKRKRNGKLESAGSKAGQWAPSIPSGPMLSPEDDERIRREAKSAAAELKAKLAMP